MDPFILGSKFFDIFALRENAAIDYEQLIQRIKEMGAKIEQTKIKNNHVQIRIHNDGAKIPTEALDYAQYWAESHAMEYAYQ